MLIAGLVCGSGRVSRQRVRNERREQTQREVHEFLAVVRLHHRYLPRREAGHTRHGIAQGELGKARRVLCYQQRTVRLGFDHQAGGDAFFVTALVEESERFRLHRPGELDVGDVFIDGLVAGASLPALDQFRRDRPGARRKNAFLVPLDDRANGLFGGHREKHVLSRADHFWCRHECRECVNCGLGHVCSSGKAHPRKGRALLMVWCSRRQWQREHIVLKAAGVCSYFGKQPLVFGVGDGVLHQVAV